MKVNRGNFLWWAVLVVAIIWSYQLDNAFGVIVWTIALVCDVYKSAFKRRDWGPRFWWRVNMIFLFFTAVVVPILLAFEIGRHYLGWW